MTDLQLRPNSRQETRDFLLVSEIYGSVVQGEGPSVGRPCTFLRLGGCNLTCGAINPESGIKGWVCDTSYTWDWAGVNGTKYDPRVELHRMSIDEVINEIIAVSPPTVEMLVISGGEPMLQSAGIGAMLGRLRQTRYFRIEVETNGTVVPNYSFVGSYVTQFNCSPKLSNSGNTTKKRKLVRWYVKRDQTIFKFVVTCEQDLHEIDQLVEEFKIDPSKIYIMPEGRDAETLRQHSLTVMQAVIDRGWRLTPRLHIALFGNRRGV